MVFYKNSIYLFNYKYFYSCKILFTFVFVKNCINTDDLISVSAYAKSKSYTREQLYYYIKMGFLKVVTIGGVIFVKKNAKICFPKKELPKKPATNQEKGKKYLETNKVLKIKRSYIQ